jgi:hypothetical protein
MVGTSCGSESSYADPDPACHFDAYADPDPSFQVKAQNLKKVLKYSVPYILTCRLQIDADPDPDPACYFAADTDPAYQFDTDPDPTFKFDALVRTRYWYLSNYYILLFCFR